MCKELKMYDTQQFKGSLTGKMLIYPYEKDKKMHLFVGGKRVLQRKQDITFIATTFRWQYSMGGEGKQVKNNAS
jgi:hypothetical protein